MLALYQVSGVIVGERNTKSCGTKDSSSSEVKFCLPQWFSIKLQVNLWLKSTRRTLSLQEYSKLSFPIKVSWALSHSSLANNTLRQFILMMSSYVILQNSSWFFRPTREEIKREEEKQFVANMVPLFTV